MAYDAFISYSHAADSQLAPRLQDGLQRLAKPWWRRRALNVFRDTTGLSANPGLWTSITTAMDDSRWFVFLASPEAAASPWVQREIEHWLETQSPDRILPVLTDGTWVWDAAADDFDWAASSAVPLVLAGAFSEEPRHVDLSWARSEEQLDLRHGRFRDQVAEVAAPLRGMAKDELEGADIREHRRTLRWAWGAAIGLVALLLISATAGVVAARNASEADRSREQAEASAQEASDRRRDAELSEARAIEQQEIAEENEAIAEQQRRETEIARDDATAAADTAIAAERAAETSRDNEARSANEARESAELATRNQREAEERRNEAIAERTRADELTVVAETGRQVEAGLRLDAERLATSERAAKEQAQDATTKAEQSEKTARAAEARAVESAKIATKEKERADAEAAAAVIARDEARTEALASSSAAQADQDGPLSLLLAVESSRVGEAAARRAAAPDDAASAMSAAEVGAAAASSATGRRALFQAVTAARGGTDAFPVERYISMPSGVTDAPVQFWRPAISPAGRYLAAAELADPLRGARGTTPIRVVVWDLSADPVTVKVLSGHTEQLRSVEFAAGGATLVTQDEPVTAGVLPTVRMWDVETGELLRAVAGRAHVAPDGEHVVVQLAGGAGRIEFLDAEDGTSLGTVSGLLDTTGATSSAPGWSAAPFSPDGGSVLGFAGGSAMVWDVASGGRSSDMLLAPGAASSSAPRLTGDGTLAVAIQDDAALGFFELGTSNEPLSFETGFGQPVDLAWNLAGTRLAVLHAGGQLLVLDLDGDGSAEDWALTVPAPFGGARELAVSPDGSVISVTTTSDEETVRDFAAAFDTATSLHSMADGRRIAERDGAVLAVSGGPAPSSFFRSNDGRVGMVRNADGTVLHQDGSDAGSSTVSVDPAGRRLVASSSAGVRVWDLRSGVGPIRAAGVSSLITGVVFDPLDDGLVGVGASQVVSEWDLSRQGAAELLGTTSQDAAALDDGVTVVEPTIDRRGVELRDMVTGAVRSGPTLGVGIVDYVVAGPAGNYAVNATGGDGAATPPYAVVVRPDGTPGRVRGTVVAFSRDGSRIASRSGAVVVVHRTSDLDPVGEIDLSALPAGDVVLPSVFALDPTGSLLAVTNSTGSAVVWDVADGTVVTRISGRPADRLALPAFGLAFAPDGRHLVLNSPSNLVRRFAVDRRASTWKVTATQQLDAGFAARVVFSPDGTLLAIDGLQVLDATTLAPIATLTTLGPGASTAFSSDGRWLMTISSTSLDQTIPGGVVRRWSVDPARLRVDACRLAGRDLTVDEWTRFVGDAVPYRPTCT